MLKERNIAIQVILSIVTCGLYTIVWFISLTDDAAYINDDHILSGLKAFLFSLLTCGIYTIYWNYKMGKTLYEGMRKRGIEASDNSLIYLILSILGLGIVNYCIMQNDINKVATQTN